MQNAQVTNLKSTARVRELYSTRIRLSCAQTLDFIKSCCKVISEEKVKFEAVGSSHF